MIRLKEKHMPLYLPNFDIDLRNEIFFAKAFLCRKLLTDMLQLQKLPLKRTH